MRISNIFIWCASSLNPFILGNPSSLIIQLISQQTLYVHPAIKISFIQVLHSQKCGWAHQTFFSGLLLYFQHEKVSSFSWSYFAFRRVYCIVAGLLSVNQVDKDKQDWRKSKFSFSKYPCKLLKFITRDSSFKFHQSKCSFYVDIKHCKFIR